MADEPRTIERATEAFVDRAPIDWTALLSRIDDAADRTFVQRLHALHALRERNGHSSRSPAAQWRFGASVVIIASAVQLALMVAVLMVSGGLGPSVAIRVPQLVLALAFACAGAGLLPSVRREAGSLFLLATFTSSAAAFARSAIVDWPNGWIETLANVPLVAFTPACLWQFASDFPRVRRFAPFDLMARRAAAASWLLGLLLVAANAGPARGTVGHAAAYLVRDHPAHVFWHLFALAIVPAVAAIFVRAHRAPANEHRKVTRFACALGGGSAPFFVSGVAWAMWPSFAQQLQHIPLVDPITLTALMATPLLASIAVVSDERRPVRTVVRHAIESLARRMAHPLSHPFVNDEPRLAVALERLRRARSRREAYAVLVREMRRTTSAVAARVLAADGSGGFEDPWRGAIRLPPGTMLAALAASTAAPVDLTDARLLSLLPPREHDWVVANEWQISSPVKRRDGTLAAIVFVGRRRDDRRFDRPSRWAIAALSSAMASVCERDTIDRDARDRSSASDKEDAAFECPECGIVCGTNALSCGFGSPPDAAALPIRLADQFVLVRRLGAGAAGVVYLARDTRLGRFVAMKTLPELRAGSLDRLRREAQAMAALSHETLATIYSLEVWRRTPILIVEWLERGTLDRRLAAGPLEPRDVVNLGVRIARALAHVHGRGVVHRDVKPGNIGLTAAGEGKLLDFGLATVMPGPEDDDAVHGARIAGTLAYLPPEALRGAPAGTAFDLWALSVTLLECATGSNPFAPSPAGFSERRLRRFCGRRVPAALRPFFDRALAWSPERRFRDAIAMQRELERLLAGL
jgi:hypothetical protein